MSVFERVYACACERAYECFYVNVCECTYVSVVCVYECMCVCVFVSECKCVLSCECVCICLCKCVKVRVCEQESHFCHQAVRGECHSINIEKNEALNYEQKEQAMNFQHLRVLIKITIFCGTCPTGKKANHKM